MASVTTEAAERPDPRGARTRVPEDSLAGAARRLAATTAAGALLGALVGGVLGRLAMLALARLNPGAAGMTSDDGFVIGQFTLFGSLNLLLAGMQLGVVGAVLYTVLRPLLIGPRWFQVLAVGVGPAVVVGELLVHVDGVDFTLDPVWLAIAVFVVLPGVYAALLTVLAERWLAPDRFFARGRLPLALAPLAAFGPLAPLLLVLAAAWLLLRAVRRRTGSATTAAGIVAWSARAALAGIFCLSLVRLVHETRLLV